MSSLLVIGDRGFYVDYSITTGRIRQCDIRGETVFDEHSGIDAPEWKRELAECVHENYLDEDDGKGLHAFVYRLIDDGYLAPHNAQPSVNSATNLHKRSKANDRNS